MKWVKFISSKCSFLSSQDFSWVLLFSQGYFLYVWKRLSAVTVVQFLCICIVLTQAQEAESIFVLNLFQKEPDPIWVSLLNIPVKISPWRVETLFSVRCDSQIENSVLKSKTSIRRLQGGGEGGGGGGVILLWRPDFTSKIIEF